MNLSVVLPVYNEQEGIENAVEKILSALTPLCQHLEVLTINDGSSDNTAAILEKISQRNRRVKVITHKKNKGYGAALRTGIKYAKYTWIFFTDADMQFDVRELKDFFPLTKDHDFIVGYRKKRADHPRRIFISFWYNRINRMLFGLKLRDVDCAFKLMRKSAVQKVPFHSNSFFVSVELMVKAAKKKHSITERGVNHFPRKKGVSKVTLRQIGLTVRDLWKLHGSLQ